MLPCVQREKGGGIIPSISQISDHGDIWSAYLMHIIPKKHLFVKRNTIYWTRNICQLQYKLFDHFCHTGILIIFFCYIIRYIFSLIMTVDHSTTGAGNTNHGSVIALVTHSNNICNINTKDAGKICKTNTFVIAIVAIFKILGTGKK